MGKNNEKIIHALTEISVKFDELGFVPTTLNNDNYEYFVDWFKDEIKTIREESLKQETTISNLETKLAESEKDLEIVYVEGKYEIREYCEITNTQQEEIFKLKQQLAEKEKEIEELNYRLDLKFINYTNNEVMKWFDNQTAIAELEKVKEYNKGLVYSSSLIDKFINQQIKSLKGEE